MANKLELAAIIPTDMRGTRLDLVISKIFPDYSRSRIKEWVLNNCVNLDGKIKNIPKEKVIGGEQVLITAEIEKAIEQIAQDIDLNIVYEDDDIIVINKPAGLVVHPGAGNQDGTVLNALLHHYPAINNVPRAGIVHRLDKDTTGLMVVAKNIPAQTHLTDAIQHREITREYEAVINGVLTAGGIIDEPIGRHPTKRTHMAVIQGGRDSITHYRVAEKYNNHSLLRLRLETGRTHQIRVHMAHIKHSLVGDPVYGGRWRLPKGASVEMKQALQDFKRQALHARMLEFNHPITGELMHFEAETPIDMQNLINELKKDKTGIK